MCIFISPINGSNKHQNKGTKLGTVTHRQTHVCALYKHEELTILTVHVAKQYLIYPLTILLTYSPDTHTTINTINLNKSDARQLFAKIT